MGAILHLNKFVGINIIVNCGYCLNKATQRDYLLNILAKKSLDPKQYTPFESIFPSFTIGCKLYPKCLF